MDGVRIAMWSGPRNISTALMRSWGSRCDTFVSDEPLYGHYLRATGVDHPGAEEVIASSDCDWRSVVADLTGPIPGGKRVWYQKHMAHHLVEGMDRGWIGGLSNCLLIREPREMLASFTRVVERVTVEETGLPRQVELFEMLSSGGGGAPPVIVASDVLKDPAGMLRALCERLGVSYTDAMLRWEAGGRETDGVWARHWYASVERSTGFDAYRERVVEIPARLEGVLRACEALYERLHEHRIRTA